MLRFYLKRAVITVAVVSILLLIHFYYPTRNKIVAEVNKRNIIVPHSEYLINTPKCQILNLNPFDRKILHFIQKINRPQCSSYPPLTSVVYNSTTEEHSVIVNYTAAKYYTNSSTVKCCVKKLAEDYIGMVFEPCQSFLDSFVLDERNEFVFVFCLDDKGRSIYQNMHASVVKVKKVNRKQNLHKLNVLLLGLDSMSRLNFYRTMPQTVTHLHTHGWTEISGYNKIADNTLPNMMAFLTGLPPEHFNRAHRLNFDLMPFIWKEFSKAGYATAYAEDLPLVSTFNCHLSGFRYPPTDHYFREYIYYGELLLMGHGRPPGCIANKLSSEHVFDYMLDFVTVYKEYSYFGLFWVNQISHNNLNRASGEDGSVLEVLKKLEESRAMNTTMVVLLSDHGLRIGDFRKSYHGWYEDRLPLLFISVPEWFKVQKEQYFLNLLMNSNRLTSPFDLYLTMKHVLTGRPSTALGCRACHSLFLEVSPDRSCIDAGISPHWCTCHPFSDLPYSDLSEAAANRLVDKINEKLSFDPDIESHHMCAQLTVRSILYVREKIEPGRRELVVGVVTDPGGAEFEGTVVVSKYNLDVERSISRLNNYGNETQCADNPISKLFCHCVPNHSHVHENEVFDRLN